MHLPQHFSLTSNDTSSRTEDVFNLRVWEVVWYCLICVVGIAGNFMVCFVIIRSGRTVRNAPFNMLLMSLAVADLLTAAVVVPNYILSTSVYNHPSGEAGTILCKSFTGYGLPFYLALVSVYSLVAISIERLKAVTNPIRTYTESSTKRTWFIIAVIWVGAITIEAPTVIGIHYSRKRAAVGNFCYYDWEYSWLPAVIYGTVFTVQFIFPFLIFVFTFYKIRKCFQNMDKALKNVVVTQGIEQQQLRINKRKRTVKIVLFVILAFFFCWTPNNVMYFLFQYVGIGKMEWNSAIYQFGVLAAFSNACINPFLYCFQSEEFRRYSKKVFKGCFGIMKERKPSYKLLKEDNKNNDESDSENGSLLQSTSDRERVAAYPL